MRYANIEGLQKPLSRIVLGTSSKPMWRGENCDEIFDAAFQGGITVFDTARGYGESEKILGDWLNRRGLGKQVVVQSKGALHGLLGNTRVKEKCIRADLEKSLSALNIDCIDSYLLHRDNPKEPVGWMVELLNEFHALGKVNLFGVSNWSHTRIEQANEYAYAHNLLPLSISQPQFSLAEAGRWTWIGCLSVTGEKNREARAWYAQTQFPLMAFSPLGGGVLSGKVKSYDLPHTKKHLSLAMQTTFCSKDNIERLKRLEKMSQETGHAPAALALAWALAQDLNVFVITGASKLQSLQTTLSASEITLTNDQLLYMNLQSDTY